MRLVPSPTSRLTILSALTGLAASFMLSSPASAVAPQAPGDFTGHGFDACVAPSQSVMDTWNVQSPFSAVGIYISGNSRYCGDKYQPNLSKAWVAKNASRGWRFIPIHVGRQAPCFKNNPKSRVQKKHMSSTVSTARSQGRAEAKETIAALKKFGFGAGSVSYLDIEWYARTKKCDNIVIEFSDAWTEYLHSKGYKSGLYSSGSAAIKAFDEARAAKRKGFTLPDQMWIAWVNKVADTDGGPYMSDKGWANHQRIHQYHNGVDVTYGKKKLNIDKNFLDVGKGSVATKQAQPCKVNLSMTSYPRLKQGNKGPAVRALECLLKARGLMKNIDSSYGWGTVNAVKKYQKARGWRERGYTTKATWTSLLASGTNPQVLKQGSVGEPVWRLQRSLISAGLKPRLSGVYDAKTVSAVKAYRRALKLPSYPSVENGMWQQLRRGKIA